MARWQLVDRVLLVAVLSLIPWAWGTGCERAKLEAVHARLVAEAGELDVADPSQVHIKAIPTGEPLRFAWRYYFPAKRFSYRCGIPGSQAGPNASKSRLAAGEGILKLGLRERQGGDGFEVSVLGADETRRINLGDRSLVELLRGRWDRVEVEQAAAAGPVEADSGTPLTLVRLRLPPDLVAEAGTRPAGLARTIPPVFFEFTINPRGAAR